LPLFLNLSGRTVLLVGGGRVATAKLQQLMAAGARVRVVAPEVSDQIRAAVHPPGHDSIAQRPFTPSDLDGVWLVVAAATPEVNRAVADAAEPRHVFVNAVDDPVNASAFLSGVVRRDGVTIAVSTRGDAPALTALLREGLDALLPRDLASWVWRARAERVAWRRDATPMEARKPLLLRALNALYGTAAADDTAFDTPKKGARGDCIELSAFSTVDAASRVPWLNAPEDSWL
jgi:uroporphyrin-III C-methyltransferase / precorrin-2 dehydrogenase / sirohydrochlorin ferrochelatase